MASVRQLKRKIKSVTSTQKITKAMKMVSVARLTRAQNRILAGRPFADKMERLLGELAYLIRRKEADSVAAHHPFLEKRKSNRVDLVLVTADRGLCGAFNASLIRRTVQYMRENPDDEVHLWIVGKKGASFFRRMNARVNKEYINYFQRLVYHHAEIIGKDVIDAFLNNNSREVIFLYQEFKSRIQQKLIFKSLLPIGEIKEAIPKVDFLYEPSRKEILEAIFPRYLNAQIYRILLESQAAELAARLTAMDNATNNARDLIDSLTVTMNKVRQAGITKEISEIVGGVEALQAD